MRLKPGEQRGDQGGGGKKLDQPAEAGRELEDEEKPNTKEGAGSGKILVSHLRFITLDYGWGKGPDRRRDEKKEQATGSRRRGGTPTSPLAKYSHKDARDPLCFTYSLGSQRERKASMGGKGSHEERGQGMRKRVDGKGKGRTLNRWGSALSHKLAKTIVGKKRRRK